MYNKERIKQLRLIWSDKSGLTSNTCLSRMQIDFDCSSSNCAECSTENIERHSELINEEENFECTRLSCEAAHELFYDNDEKTKCSECKKKIKKYIQEDFKEIFNKFGDTYV